MKLKNDQWYKVSSGGQNIGRYYMTFGGASNITLTGAVRPSADGAEVHPIRNDTAQPAESIAVMLMPFVKVTGMAEDSEVSLVVMGAENESALLKVDETGKIIK